MEGRFELWLEPSDDKTRAWLIELSCARPALTLRDARPDLELAQWYAAQLCHLTAAVRADRTLTARRELQFVCVDAHTNFVGGEAVHAALLAARLQLAEAHDWKSGDEFEARLAALSRTIAVLASARGVVDAWTDLPAGKRRELVYQLATATGGVRALVFWWYAKRNEDVLPPLAATGVEEADLAALRDRFDCLSTAETLVPAELRVARGGWSANLAGQRLLAQAQVARALKKHDAAAAFWRAAAERRCESDNPDLAEHGALGLEDATFAVPRANLADKRFVRGVGIGVGPRRGAEEGWVPKLQ